MAAVTFVLGREAVVDWLTVALAALAAIAVFRFKVNSAWIVLAGGLVGFVSQWL
jgi:chromate transporter